METSICRVCRGPITSYAFKVGIYWTRIDSKDPLIRPEWKGIGGRLACSPVCAEVLMTSKWFERITKQHARLHEQKISGF